MRTLWRTSIRHQLTLSHVLVAFFLSLALGAVSVALVWRQTRAREQELLQRVGELASERFLAQTRRLEETRDGLYRELARRPLRGYLPEMVFLHGILNYTDVDRLEVFSGLQPVIHAFASPLGADPSLATRWYPESPQVAALLQDGRPVTWCQPGRSDLVALKTARKLPGQQGREELVVVVTLAFPPSWLAGVLPRGVTAHILLDGKPVAFWPPSGGSSNPPWPVSRHRQSLARLDDDRTIALELAASPYSVFQALGPALRGGVLLSLVSLTLALLLGRGLATRILAPLNDLLEGTAAMARGHLSVRLPVRREDELGQLTREFNRMADEVRTTYLGVIATLAEVVEAKSHYTREHIERVERLAMTTAQVLEERGWAKWSSHQKFILSVAAILHDVGKISIGNDILNKPGPLDSRERGEILSHPEVGATIVQRMGKLDRAAEIIRACHEHYDGSGYPRGLKGEEIPLEARIILAVDAYDAMTQVRPYSKARPVEEAVAELRAEAGKQFDPVVVEALIEAVSRLESGQAPPTDSSSGLYQVLATDSGEAFRLRS